MINTLIGFLGFTLFVIVFVWYRLKNENLKSEKGYFLAGRSLTGPVIAASMLLTNISTEHLIGMNGNAYKNGIVVIAWEVTSAIALVIAALYFIPRYIKMGLTTVPEYLENRYDAMTRTLVAVFLMISFVVTLLPIVLYTGAINIESIFDVSSQLGIHKSQGLWYTVIVIGVIGSAYAIFGGLKAVAYSDMLNGIGLLIGGLLIPVLALYAIGDGRILKGVEEVYKFAPEKFNIIGSNDSVLPFSTLFTGLMINQLYFWGMNQTIIQRAFGAKNLAEAQKGLLYTGVLKILIPIVIVLPGLIAFYYFQDQFYENPDTIYPILVKKVLPSGLTGFFAAVILGAVLSTFNSVLNSASTIFCFDLYKKHFQPDIEEMQLVKIGKWVAVLLAVFAILTAPMVAQAPDGLYQLLQQLNGIFFIPIASILLAGLFTKNINANGAKAGLLFGFIFYILTTFIFDTGIHFVHIWGIEFVLNILIMWIVSKQMPTDKVPVEKVKDSSPPWAYAKIFGAALILITVIIYILLAQ
ncbi:solute:sodium symporter family transporter [Marinilongibacter aquaticus]|uniref:solute:sodium symporter family transporter n=1 Tax=Marinilongibacter aquaticus TaxID=2975157 RepID=UPI0021BDB19A|nr:solute:sodium symporter family transporter [Marinilongibacter aquaticus]UBM58986.1 solute:sodium symporter family transporter [Marinilongibacter aquaticus]